MLSKLLGISLIIISFCFNCHAETIVWSGDVDSKGAPTTIIPLTRLEKYQIKVSGTINLGKWIQNNQELANDACYEYSKEGTINRYVTIKNSLDISVCDGKYHSDHIYQSLPFTAEQSAIHFWVHDTDYEDNSGVLHVEIIRL